VTLRVHPDEIVKRSSSPLLAKHGSWERVRLGEVADVLNGFAFKSSEFSKDGGMPLIRIRDVGSQTKQVRYAGDFDSRYIVQPRTILIGMDGDFRAARWKGEPALLNQRVCTISVRSRDLYNEDFLLYALPGYLDAIHGATSSTTVKHLSSETIKQIPLPLPPLAEQRRIVAAIEEQLSRLETAAAALSGGNARLELFRRSAEVSRLNGDWPTRPLAELVDPERPIRYGILMPKEHIVDGVLYVRVRDFPRGKVLVNELRRTSHEIAHKYRRSSLMPGDVLVSIRGTFGRVAVAPPELDGANITQDTARVALVSDVNRDYVVAYLRSEAAQRFFRSVARGVAVRGVNLGDLREMPVPIPPLDEQERVAQDAERASTLIEALSAEVTQAERRSDTLRTAILARAFRGELVAQDPEDEPPSALLRRIAAQGAATRGTLGRRKRTPA
jgi:type I restriction enzyme S subunit